MKLRLRQNKIKKEATKVFEEVKGLLKDEKYLEAGIRLNDYYNSEVSEAMNPKEQEALLEKVLGEEYDHVFDALESFLFHRFDEMHSKIEDAKEMLL